MSVYFDLDLHILTVCGGTHNGTYRLSDPALLADHSADIVFRNVKMINDYAFFVDFVNIGGDCIGFIDKTFCNVNE